jgi:hypothetical protein
MAKILSQEEFLLRIISIHGDKYDYSLMDYRGHREKVKVICPIHGEFETSGASLLKGSGCRKCAFDALRKTQEQFLQECIDIHGDKYDYSKVVYVSDAKKVIIGCPIHGDFEQRPNSHLQGSGCTKCKNKPLEDWITRFKDVHGDKYNYDKVPYVLARSHITVTCPEHGDFEVLANNHGNGVGCPKCFTVHNKFSEADFVSKVSLIHDNYYTYENCNYVDYSQNITVTCPTHGEFIQKAFSHASGHGCPKCFGKISKAEFQIVEYIKSLGISDDKILMSSSPEFMVGKQQLDIYIPEFNFAVEFNGSRWHSENWGKPNSYHYDKWKMCHDAGVKLLTIWDFNWCNPLKARIYKSKISHLLGLDTKIYARKTIVSEVEKEVAIDFVRNNHIEGFSVPYRNSKYVGLYLGDLLLMVAIYGEFYQQGLKRFDWKLQRIVSLNGFTIVGGVSKLSRYIKNDVGEFVFQITLDTGGTLLNNFDSNLIPSFRYWWVNSKMEVRSRNSCQVLVLKKNDDWEENDTENSYMIKKGFYKVFDCGILTLKS